MEQSAPGGPRCDVSTLVACIEWSRDKLEKLSKYSEDTYTVSNLGAIIASMDPEKNPKIKSVYDRHRRGEAHDHRRSKNIQPEN